MNQTYNGRTGNTGEDMAAAWLQDKGFSIIQRNWRYKHLEIDIIASKGKKIHFVEIKNAYL
jgi:putative endonuclease